MNVLMVGVSPKRYGGMWTVVQNYMESAEYQSQVNLIYVSTSTNGSKLRRILCMLLGYIKILFFLMTKNIDIVHVHMAEKGSVFRKGLVVKWGKKFRCKVMIHMHAGAFMNWYYSKTPRTQHNVCEILNVADKVIVLGEYWKKQMEDILPREKIYVLYNGVKVQKKNEYSPESKDIVYMGVVRREKGIDDLLQAIVRLDAKLDTNVKLFIYGTDIEGNIQEKIKNMKLENRVQYKGWIKEKDAVLKSAMLSVLPSYYEGLSMSVIEAMSYGIPVITTDISTMREVLGEQSFLIAPGDVEALANEIESYCESIMKRKQTSEYLYTRARNIFSIEEHISKLLKLYEEILAN